MDYGVYSPVHDMVTLLYRTLQSTGKYDTNSAKVGDGCRQKLCS